MAVDVYKSIEDSHTAAVALVEQTGHFTKEIEAEGERLIASIHQLDEKSEKLRKQKDETLVAIKALREEAENDLGHAEQELGKTLQDLEAQLSRCISRFEETAHHAEKLEAEVGSLEVQLQPYLDRLDQRLDEQQSALEGLRESLAESLRERTEHLNSTTAVALRDLSGQVEQATGELSRKISDELIPSIEEQAQLFAQHIEEVLARIEERCHAEVEAAEHSVDTCLSNVGDQIGDMVAGTLLAKGTELDHVVSEISQLIDDTMQIIEDITAILNDGVTVTNVGLETVVDLLRELEELFSSVL
jgi:chromosome segregation ATPase